MKRIYVLIFLISSFTATQAKEYIENINILSEDYNNYVNDIAVERFINGGTVIYPRWLKGCMC